MAKIGYTDLSSTEISCRFTIRELKDLDGLMVEHGEDWQKYSSLLELHKQIRDMLRDVGRDLVSEGQYTTGQFDEVVEYKVKPKVVERVEDLLDDEIPY
tara:strand:+ start:643 stop:939 length:297 start_codon:yes stop_codon:yes gene_type:complete